MIENARARIHSKSSDVRTLYFVYAAVVFNAWVMANAMLMHMASISAGSSPIIQQDFKDVLLLYCAFDNWILPEPPPPVLP